MNMKPSVYILCFFLLYGSGARLQAQVFGGHSLNQGWQQINTARYRVIFPELWQSQGQWVANFLHRIDTVAATSLGPKHKKIDMVLQPFTTRSNGYVSYSPFRSELMVTSPSNIYGLGSGNWLEQLAVHEYRHVQQYNNFRVGIARWLYWLYGEDMIAMLNDAAIPNYFWEGDAVYHETRYSNVGRGRTPYFFNGFKALWENNIDLNWMQWRNGSLRKQIPNHYALGYLMTAYGYEKYGDDFWKNITEDAVRFKGLFYSFQRSFRKNYQQKYSDFTAEAMAYFREQYPQLPDEEKTDAIFESNQYWPYTMNDSMVVFLESRYDALPRFKAYNTQTGKTHSLQWQWISNEQQYHYSAGKIVYSSYTPHPRWNWTTYQDIVLYDIDYDRQRYLTRKGKYFSPALNIAGDKVVAIYQNGSFSGQLHLFRLKDSNIQPVVQEEDTLQYTAILNKDSLFYFHPRFIENDEIITTVKDQQGRMSIARIDTAGTHHYLLPFMYAQIGNAYRRNDTTFTTINVGKRDVLAGIYRQEIFYLDHGNDSIHNYYQPDFSTGNVQYSRYTVKGLQRQTVSYDSLSWKSVDLYMYERPADPFRLRSLQQPPEKYMVSAATDSFPVKNYPRMGGKFSFYRWASAFNDDKYSLTLEGSNILNNVYGNLFFESNTVYGDAAVGGSVVLGALFPRFTMKLQQRFWNSAFDQANARTVEWTDTEWGGGFSLPFSWIKKRMSHSVLFQADLTRLYRTYIGESARLYRPVNFSNIRFSLQKSAALPLAQQHIQTRWGYFLHGQADLVPGDYSSHRLIGQARLYTPGLFRNHSLDLQTVYQFTHHQNMIRFSNQVNFSRGFDRTTFEKMFKIGTNYHLPIAYPDWGFAHIGFIQRIRTQLYYDHTFVSGYSVSAQPFNTALVSAGGVLWLDGKCWNQYGLSIGLRYNVAVKNDLNIPFQSFNLMLPINF